MRDLLVVGQGTSIASARNLMESTAPDVVLLDHRLPDGDGVGAIAGLHAIRPSAKIVVLTATTSDRVLVAAMEAGAAGFIAKTQRLDDVIEGVRAAAQGESVVNVLSFGYPAKARRDPQSLSADEWIERADRRPWEEIVQEV